jgi:RNA polymerase sigma factor (sigma-70 family)
MNSFDVRVFTIWRRPGRNTSEVRWRVSGHDKFRSFTTRALADSYRAELIHAARHGQPFDPTTGQPTTSLADALGEEDQELEHTLNMAAVWTHFGELPSREQRLLMMRFYGNITQAEIGDRLGVSQMHVSRLLNHALGYLRERIL